MKHINKINFNKNFTVITNWNFCWHCNLGTKLLKNFSFTWYHSILWCVAWFSTIWKGWTYVCEMITERDVKAIQSWHYTSRKDLINLGNVWLRLQLNLVINIKPMGLWILLVGLTVGQPIFSREFLKDTKDSDFFIPTSSLFHSSIVYEK